MIQLGNMAGLWGLSAIPIILLLHFFRTQRKEKVIAGLHLWQFAAKKLPKGNIFQRLQNRYTLWMQLLIALLITLLLCNPRFGFDTPMQSCCILLDNSLSMQAGRTITSKELALQAIDRIYQKNTYYTVLTCGSETKLLARSILQKSDLDNILKEWNPNASGTNLEKAVDKLKQLELHNIRPIFITDKPTHAANYKDHFSICSVGKALNNTGFLFADRFEINEEQERISIACYNYSAKKISTILKGSIANKEIYTKQLEIEPNDFTHIQMTVKKHKLPYEFKLSPDDFELDNRVTLLPNTQPAIKIALNNLGESARHFYKAISLIPNAEIGAYAKPNLIFSTSRSDSDTTASRVYYFEKNIPEKEFGIFTDGLIMDRDEKILSNLYLDGGFWYYQKKEARRKRVSARYKETSIIEWEPHQPTGKDVNGRTFFVNLDIGRSNIFQTTSWPILMLNIVEECRHNLLGIDRSNYKCGEEILISLKEKEIPTPFIITKNGEEFNSYPKPPAAFPIADPGVYIMKYGDDFIHTIAINLLNNEESNLQNCSQKELTRQELSASLQDTNEGDQRYEIFLLILLILIVTGVMWKCQES